jgi:hypothetical protein
MVLLLSVEDVHHRHVAARGDLGVPVITLGKVLAQASLKSAAVGWLC